MITLQLSNKPKRLSTLSDKELMVFFRDDYRASGDKQLILFDIAYEPTMRKGKLYIHRHGKIRLSRYDLAEVDDLDAPPAPAERQIELSEYWLVDPRTGSASPAI